MLTVTPFADALDLAARGADVLEIMNRANVSLAIAKRAIHKACKLGVR